MVFISRFLGNAGPALADLLKPSEIELSLRELEP